MGSEEHPAQTYCKHLFPGVSEEAAQPHRSHAREHCQDPSAGEERKKHATLSHCSGSVLVSPWGLAERQAHPRELCWLPQVPSPPHSTAGMGQEEESTLQQGPHCQGSGCSHPSAAHSPSPAVPTGGQVTGLAQDILHHCNSEVPLCLWS